MTNNKKKNKILEFVLGFSIFFIPYFSGAFLFGLVGGNSIFHTPIFIISIILTWMLLDEFNKIKKEGENK